MASIRKWRLRAVAAGVGMLAATSAFVGAGCGNDAEGVNIECDSTRAYFAEFAWPVVQQNCSGCHNPQGAARESKYILKGPAEAGFLDDNLKVIKQVASLRSNEHDGQSLFLLMPTNAEGIKHGGGNVITRDSDEYKTLLGLVVRLQQNEDTCASTAEGAYTGVELLSPADTLRKASLMLAGRLPTAAETAAVKEGGEEALQAAVERLMTEDKFYSDFLRRTFADLFLTDFYLNNADNQVAGAPYANPDWYQTADKEILTQYGLSADELRRYTNIGIAQEPLALVEHVVRNDRPFSEIITADYIMVTPLSARTYGITDAEFTKTNDPLEYAEGHLSYVDPESGEMLQFPHAGVLSSPIFLSRFPTTDTNRNRHRARIVYDFFLGTDILQTAEQPLDQSAAEKISINPTLFAPACTVCHANIDPVAGAFQAFDEEGRWNPSPTWYKDMFAPGFGSRELPTAEFAYGVQWLGLQIANDDRFALSTVYNIYKGLTGQEALTAPGDFQDPLYAAKFHSFLAQANTFRAIADHFLAPASNQNVKQVIRELVMSPYFRAQNSIPLTSEQEASLAEVGMGHLLTPEQLHNKITAVMGMPWMENGNNPMLTTNPRDPSDLGRFQLFYGGQDADTVTTRITAPNGLMAAVAERMATQMSCRAVPQDVYRPADQRLLLKFVDVNGKQVDPVDLQPEDDNGISIQAAEAGIRQAIVNLHEHMLGEHLTPTHPEVERTYKLFLETWREGKQKMALSEQPLSPNLPGECQADQDPYTGVAYPDEDSITEDSDYTIRAWMAVVTYLLTDYQFLYE